MDDADPSMLQLGTVGTLGQPTTSFPSTTYNTLNISDGIINSVNEDLHSNSVIHNHYGISSVTLLNTASQPSLTPLNDAPIDRMSSCFTGRESELDFISVTTSFNTFHSDKPTSFAVYGMTGFGKSQLALQHAHQAFTAGIYSHIFWVSASTVEKISQGLSRILGLLNHADRNHPDQAVQIAAVCLWLEQSDRYGCHRWLLILDNVMVETVQFLHKHLPRQNASGTILITTRTRNVAESMANVAGQEHLILELNALSKTQSISLLLKKAGIHGTTPMDLESAEQLVSRMGCIPLAVEQAGSYMKLSGLKNMNQLLEKYDERGLKEVIRSGDDSNTYDETCVLPVFTLQLQKLDEMDPDAHKLLKMLAFLDTDNIPVDILSLGAREINDRLEKNGEHSLVVSPDPMRKVSAIHRLLKKLMAKLRMESNPLEDVPPELTCLITLLCCEDRIRAAFRHFEDLSIAQPLYNGKPSLYIHGLIQWALQQSTLVHREEGYRALAIALLCNAFQTIDDPQSPQSWDKCEIFMPHFTALRTQDATHSMLSEEYLTINLAISNYFRSRGRYSEAETLLDRLLAHRRRLFGSDDIGNLGIMYSLAGVYRDLGRYAEAESLYLPVLAAQEWQFGADHLKTLATVNSLASLHKSQGKLDEAEILYARALAGHQKQLGADHPSTLTMMNNLALLYESQGKLDGAEILYARALAAQERQLGADHPHTLTMLNNLALLYQKQGKLDEAEILYARALVEQEKQFGADHPGTLAMVSNLALLYQCQVKLDEAEILYARALEGREKRLGADHPSTLMTVHDFAYLCQQRGRNQEAEALYRRALAGQEARLRLDHPDTQQTLENLAQLLDTQGRQEEGKVLRVRMKKTDL